MYNYDKHPPIGIDFGTNNSAIARWYKSRGQNRTELYKLNTKGLKRYYDLLMPSIVFLEANEGKLTFITGKVALDKQILEPDHTVSLVKLQIHDPEYRYTLRGEKYSPIDISSEIIQALFVDPRFQNPDWVPEGIVVSVPYHFKNHQNVNLTMAINDAIQKAFVDVQEAEQPRLLGLIPEPFAAALNYIEDQLGLEGSKNITQTILVFDMGAGTLDLTLLMVDLQPTSIRAVILASEGDASFGGEDFDRLLQAYILKEEGVDFPEEETRLIKRAKNELKMAVRAAKEELSVSNTTNIFVAGMPGGGTLHSEIRRSDFEKILSGKNVENRDFGSEIQRLIEACLSKGKINNDHVDKVILVGGSSKIPFFQNIVSTNFPTSEVVDELDPFQCVVKGAALYAAFLLDKDYGHNHEPFGRKLDEVKIELRNSHALGIAKFNGQIKVQIEPNTKVPHVSNIIEYKPVKLSEDDEFVVLEELAVYQGEDPFAKEENKVGVVEIPTIYTHGRSKNDIKVRIWIELTATEAFVNINIPKGARDASDINIRKMLKL